MSSGLVGFGVVSGTEQIRGICSIRAIRDEAVVVLSSASVLVLLSAPVPRSASDEGFVRATLLRQVEPIINNFSITQPGTDEPQ